MWEYLLVAGLVLFAAAYLVRHIVRRLLSSRGACGDNACSCGGASPAHSDRLGKRQELVELRVDSPHGDE